MTAPSYYPPAPVATPAPFGAGYEAQGSGSNQIASYEQHQYEGLNQQGFAMPRQFVGGSRESSSIGVVVAQARMPLSDGQIAQGLLILDVKKDSPAAKAGLEGYHQAVQSVLTGATVVAAMVFPPAILALPVIDYTGVGQSYEIIIGVDGIRVTNFMDFDDQVSKAKPGEIVYLTVIRNGRRLQITVPIPLATQTATR